MPSNGIRPQLQQVPNRVGYGESAVHVALSAWDVYAAGVCERAVWMELRGSGALGPSCPGPSPEEG